MLWTAPTLRHQSAIGWLRRNEPLEGEPSMGEVSTIGLDIAKSVFQIHGVDAAGAVVVRKRITRAKLLEFFAALPACLVGIEACPTAHYWRRRLQPLGHTVRSPRLFRNPNCFTGGGAPVALVSGSACILGCLVCE